MERKKSDIIKLITNKFFIATVIFLTWILFFDENSIVSHQNNKNQLLELIKQKEYYKNKIASDKQKLKDLNAGNEDLEKFAREQFKMSKPDEDVYIVVKKK